MSDVGISHETLSAEVQKAKKLADAQREARKESETPREPQAPKVEVHLGEVLTSLDTISKRHA